MDTQNTPKHTALLIVLDGLLSLAVMALAGYYLEYFFSSIDKGSISGQWGLVALMFLCMAISQTIQIYLARAQHRLEVLRHTVYMVIFLICAG